MADQPWLPRAMHGKLCDGHMTSTPMRTHLLGETRVPGEDTRLVDFRLLARRAALGEAGRTDDPFSLRGIAAVCATLSMHVLV